MAKIIPPSNQVLTELLDHLSYAPTTGTPRDLPDLSLETLDGRLAKKEAKAAHSNELGGSKLTLANFEAVRHFILGNASF